ncbi:hypothetical protein E4T56_gene9014 [Termitomyces sp. T112]|nr:hypothetical protein E4T56_gene9014 [Termitomyces sp. T112]
MTALPPATESERMAMEKQSEISSQYENVVNSNAIGLIPPKKTLAKYSDSILGIRVLGYLLKDLWEHRNGRLGFGPYHHLGKKIASCLRSNETSSEPLDEHRYEKLVELGLLYRNHLIRVSRSNAGSTPATSTHPSRNSFDTHTARILKELGEVPHKRSAVKSQALLRDNFKCVLTGSYDAQSLINIPFVKERYESECIKSATYTEVAYIFSAAAQEENPVLRQN